MKKLVSLLPTRRQLWLALLTYAVLSGLAGWWIGWDDVLKFIAVLALGVAIGSDLGYYVAATVMERQRQNAYEAMTVYERTMQKLKARIDE
jgi:hypothetical protein